jgi:hypothetical protein
MLNHYHLKFLRLLASRSVRFLVIGGQARRHHSGTETGDLDIWADSKPQNMEALIQVFDRWREQHPRHEVKRPDVRLWYPDDTRLWLRGNDPEAGGIDILTRIEAFDFEQFFGRSVPVEVDGLEVQFLAGQDVSAFSIHNDA